MSLDQEQIAIIQESYRGLGEQDIVVLESLERGQDFDWEQVSMTTLIIPRLVEESCARLMECGFFSADEQTSEIKLTEHGVVAQVISALSKKTND
jgi:hypothetical protein